MKAREYIRVDEERAEVLKQQGWQVAATSWYGDGQTSVLLFREVSDAVPDGVSHG